MNSDKGRSGMIPSARQQLTVKNSKNSFFLADWSDRAPKAGINNPATSIEAA